MVSGRSSRVAAVAVLVASWAGSVAGGEPAGVPKSPAPSEPPEVSFVRIHGDLCESTDARSHRMRAFLPSEVDRIEPCERPIEGADVVLYTVFDGGKVARTRSDGSFDFGPVGLSSSYDEIAVDLGIGRRRRNPILGFARSPREHPSAYFIRIEMAPWRSIRLLTTDGESGSDGLDGADPWRASNDELREFLQEGVESLVLEDIDGRRWTWSDLRGRVAVLDFWATWCEPCVEELPYMRRAAHAVDPRDAVVLGVSRDTMAVDVFREALERLEIDWPQVLEAEQEGETPSERLAVGGIPRTIILDRSGCVVAVSARGVAVREIVEKLVAGDVEGTGWCAAKGGADGE